MGIKFPTPWKTLIIKFPPPRDGKGVKCPGCARWGGGGMLKLPFDRYIKVEGYIRSHHYSQSLKSTLCSCVIYPEEMLKVIFAPCEGSRTVLDPEFHAVDSGSKVVVLDSSIYQ